MKTYTVEVNSEHVNSLNLGDNEYVARRFAIDCAERALSIFEGGYFFDLRPRRAIEAARQFIEQRKDSLDSVSLFDDLANELVKLSAAAWDAAWMWAPVGPKHYAAEAAAFAAAMHLPANVAARSAAASAIAAIAERARMAAMGEGAEIALETKQHVKREEEVWQETRLKQLMEEVKKVN